MSLIKMQHISHMQSKIIFLYFILTARNQRESQLEEKINVNNILQLLNNNDIFKLNTSLNYSVKYSFIKARIFYRR